MNVLEFNTGNCILANGAFVASFVLLVETGVAPSAVRTWHYYGVLVPGPTIGGVSTVQHDAIVVLLETPELVELAQSTAKDLAVAEFPAE